MHLKAFAGHFAGTPHEAEPYKSQTISQTQTLNQNPYAELKLFSPKPSSPKLISLTDRIVD